MKIIEKKQKVEKVIKKTCQKCKGLYFQVMKKKILLEITPQQLEALKNIVDEASAMIGVGEDEDLTRIKRIKLVDRMLKKNGFKRDYL